MDKSFWKVEIFDEVDSTNSALKAIAESTPEGKVYIAKRQTAGKGSKGRSFVSLEGGLYMSLLLKPRKKGFEGVEITALTAVAMAEAIEEVFSIKVGIKWVNDLIYKGKKLAGILVEGKMKEDAFDYAIVGIGVNLTPFSEEFPTELKGSAIYLKDRVTEEEKDSLVSSFLSRFYHFYRENGEYKREYFVRSVLIGREVTLKLSDKVYEGVAVGIDENNRLVVKIGERERAFSSGEVIKVNYGKGY